MRWSGLSSYFKLELFLVAGVISLAVFQAPHERFLWRISLDPGVDLTIHDLTARGFRPTVDFGLVYGLLPPLVNRVWYTLAGTSPRAYRVELVLGTCLTALGMARFARARRVGAAGVALIALSLPDVLFSTYSTSVHVFEPALLVHGLAEHARGRRATALALATAACFVKPSMGFVYGLVLCLCIAVTLKGSEWRDWARALGPSALVGVLLAVVLATTYGVGPLVRTILPGAGMSNYRLERYGFFRGTGREFWVLPEGSLRAYFRYEVGFWLIGTAWLIASGIASLWRLGRGGPFRPPPRPLSPRERMPEGRVRGPGVDEETALQGQPSGDERRDDEVIVCIAALHVAFVTCFYAHRMSWAYYFAILILGLAATAKGRRRAAVVWLLAAMLLVSDRSKLLTTYREWSTSAPGPETLGLWATPAERSEWLEVLRRTRGHRPVLLSEVEGSVPLVPGFASPVAAYFFPGICLPVEARRKAKQLAAAGMIVATVPRDWRGFRLWPELAAALDGCEPAFEGDAFRLYRRVRPPSRPSSHRDASGLAPRSSSHP